MVAASACWIEWVDSANGVGLNVVTPRLGVEYGLSFTLLLFLLLLLAFLLVKWAVMSKPWT